MQRLGNDYFKFGPVSITQRARALSVWVHTIKMLHIIDSGTFLLKFLGAVQLIQFAPVS